MYYWKGDRLLFSRSMSLDISVSAMRLSCTYCTNLSRSRMFFSSFLLVLSLYGLYCKTADKLRNQLTILTSGSYCFKQKK